MTAPTPGQAAHDAMHALCRKTGDPCRSWEEIGPRLREKWEAAAAAVETEQVRLARQDRDQLRKHVLDQAATWEQLAVKCDAAAALDGLAKAAVLEQATFAQQLNECAAALRKIAGLPS